MTGESLNNRANNLIWLTPAEHNEIHNIMNKIKRPLTKEETLNIIQEQKEINKTIEKTIEEQINESLKDILK